MGHTLSLHGVGYHAGAGRGRICPKNMPKVGRQKLADVRFVENMATLRP
jgi:hypothetical protein